MESNFPPFIVFCSSVCFPNNLNYCCQQMRGAHKMCTVINTLRAFVCKNQTYRGRGGKFDFFLILMLDRVDYN